MYTNSSHTVLESKYEIIKIYFLFFNKYDKFFLNFRSEWTFSFNNNNKKNSNLIQFFFYVH